MSFLKRNDAQAVVGVVGAMLGATIWRLVKAERAKGFTVTVTSWECKTCGYRLPMRRLSCLLRRHVVVKAETEHPYGNGS